MITYSCDRCAKELDGRNMNYVSVMIDDFADNENDPEHWQFCHDCYTIVKASILKTMVNHTASKEESN